MKNDKTEDLKKNISDPEGKKMTTNQGVKVNDTNNSLKAGERGATLLEDFILREKSPTLTMNAFLKELYMLVVVELMAILNYTKARKNIPKLEFLQIQVEKLRYLFGFQQ